MTVKYSAMIYSLDINYHTEFRLNRRFGNWC
jgi:hypothetical protein